MDESFLYISGSLLLLGGFFCGFMAHRYSVMQDNDRNRIEYHAISDRRPFSAWIAYHSDWSDMVLFRNELDALRYASKYYMQIKNVMDSESIRTGYVEVVNEEPEQSDMVVFTYEAYKDKVARCSVCGKPDIPFGEMHTHARNEHKALEVKMNPIH